MLRTAVIGVGHLGSSHARVYKKLDGCELTGIFDTDEIKASKIADGFKVKSFRSVDEVLDNCDALSIATPTTSHYEIAIKAIKAGKHVLVEKPMTADVSDAEKLISAVEDKKVKLQVGHIERFNPALTAVSGYIDKSMLYLT
jgi:predicted dehydrogenase